MVFISDKPYNRRCSSSVLVQILSRVWNFYFGQTEIWILSGADQNQIRVLTGSEQNLDFNFEIKKLKILKFLICSDFSFFQIFQNFQIFGCSIFLVDRCCRSLHTTVIIVLWKTSWIEFRNFRVLFPAEFNDIKVFEICPSLRYFAND